MKPSNKERHNMDMEKMKQALEELRNRAILLYRAEVEEGRRAAQEAVVHKVIECIDTASTYYDLSFKYPHVSFRNLRGTTAGRAIISTNALLFNPDILYANYNHYLAVTVPHEVAHLVAHAVYGDYIRVHGHEWKFVMSRVFGVPYYLCRAAHQYDVQHLKARQERKFIYRCLCQSEIEVGVRRHNNMQERRNLYVCKGCGGVLHFVKPK